VAGEGGGQFCNVTDRQDQKHRPDNRQKNDSFAEGIPIRFTQAP
jgi:hypothetical protein